MATEEEILAEPRLRPEQEDVLYNIALRQDELGRQQTTMLLDKVLGSDMYQDMIDRELLTYQAYDHGKEGVPVVCNLIVTLKGMRYCIVYADEISARRKWDAAGNARKTTD